MSAIKGQGAQSSFVKAWAGTDYWRLDAYQSPRSWIKAPVISGVLDAQAKQAESGRIPDLEEVDSVKHHARSSSADPWPSVADVNRIWWWSTFTSKCLGNKAVTQDRLDRIDILGYHIVASGSKAAEAEYQPQCPAWFPLTVQETGSQCTHSIGDGQDCLLHVSEPRTLSELR